MSNYNKQDLKAVIKFVNDNGWCYHDTIDPEAFSSIMECAGLKSKVVGNDHKAGTTMMKVWVNDLYLPPVNHLRELLNGQHAADTNSSIEEKLALFKVDCMVAEKFPEWEKAFQYVAKCDDLATRAKKVAIAAYWISYINHENVLKVREYWCDLVSKEDQIRHETKVKMRKFFDLVRLEMTLI